MNARFGPEKGRLSIGTVKVAKAAGVVVGEGHNLDEALR
jgi:hypothetical protein